MALDNAYIQGMEDMTNIIKAIFELTTGEREKKFGSVFVADILDKFDFQQIREKMQIQGTMRAKETHCYYIIRIVSEDDEGFKKVTAESKRYYSRPTFAEIDRYLTETGDINSFAVVEELYVRE